MPPFRRLLRKWLASCYEYLGLVLVLSLVAFGVTLSCLALVNSLARTNLVLGFVSGSALYAFLYAPLGAGVCYSARKILTRDDPVALDFLHGFRELFTPALRLGLARMLIYTLLITNVWFYLSRPNIVLKTLGILFLYLLLIWIVSTIYHGPMLVEQRPGALQVVKRSLLLVLDNLGFTFGLFSVIILLALFCAVTVLGLPLLSFGMMSVLQVVAVRALFVKYGVLEPEPEPAEVAPDDSWSLDDARFRTETENNDSPRL